MFISLLRIFIYNSAIHLSKNLAAKIEIDYTNARNAFLQNPNVSKRKGGIQKRLILVNSPSLNACQILFRIKDGSQM